MDGENFKNSVIGADELDCKGGAGYTESMNCRNCTDDTYSTDRLNDSMALIVLMAQIEPTT